MNTRELLEFLVENPTHDTAATLTDWINKSRRFHSFADSNRLKIRKKLRTASTPEGLRSVLLELEVARPFVEDRRCEVEYERYGQGRVRRPDLTVTFRDGTIVNLEVTQIQAPGPDPPGWDGKLIGIVGRKLGQLVPETINVLVIAPDSGALSIDAVAGAMKRLKERVEQRDAELMSRFGLTAPSGLSSSSNG